MGLRGVRGGVVVHRDRVRVRVRVGTDRASDGMAVTARTVVGVVERLHRLRHEPDRVVRGVRTLDHVVADVPAAVRVATVRRCRAIGPCVTVRPGVRRGGSRVAVRRQARLGRSQRHSLSATRGTGSVVAQASTLTGTHDEAGAQIRRVRRADHSLEHARAVSRAITQVPARRHVSAAVGHDGTHRQVGDQRAPLGTAPVFPEPRSQVVAQLAQTSRRRARGSGPDARLSASERALIGDIASRDRSHICTNGHLGERHLVDARVALSQRRGARGARSASLDSQHHAVHGRVQLQDDAIHAGLRGGRTDGELHHRVIVVGEAAHDRRAGLHEHAHPASVSRHRQRDRVSGSQESRV